MKIQFKKVAKNYYGVYANGTLIGEVFKKPGRIYKSSIQKIRHTEFTQKELKNRIAQDIEAGLIKVEGINS